MISINYKITVEAIEDKPLIKLLNPVGTYQSIRVFNSIDGIHLVTDSDLISNAFKWHPVKKATLHKRGDYIYRTEKSNTDPKFKAEQFDIMIGTLSKELFFVLFGKYMVGNIKEGIPKGISRNDTLRVIDIGKMASVKFEVDYDTGKVTPEKEGNLFLMVFKNNNQPSKVSNSFDIDKEKLLNTPSGFYQILPKYHTRQDTVSITSVGDELLAYAYDPVELTSDVYLNIDGCVTNSFLLQPGFSTPIRYGEDYTPLNEVRFDDGKEYIIFELVGTELKPIYHLSASNPEGSESYNTLMKSHHEFKRKYKVIASSALLTPGKIINNKSFQAILKSNPDIARVKI